MQSTKFIVGIIIAVICSNWVSEAIHSDGIYETDLEADGSVIFLRPSPPPALFAKTAGQIASKPVWCGRRLRCMHASARMRALACGACCSAVVEVSGQHLSMSCNSSIELPLVG